jgi:hypothetical protein
MAVNLLEIKRIFGAGIGLCVFLCGIWVLCFFGGNRDLLFLWGNWDFRASPQAETGPAHAQQSSSRRSAGQGPTAVSAFAV